MSRAPSVRYTFRVRTSFSTFVFGILVSLICLAAMPNETRAATITVVNTNDSGAGSFRDAIQQSNSTASDDVIVFSVTGTILLTSDHLLIVDASTAGKLTINGPGADQLTISGDRQSSTAYRVFYVDVGGNVEINGLTISNGNAGGACGGGIYIGGLLTLNNSTVSNNSADGGGGICVGYTAVGLKLNNSTVSHNSGLGGFSGGGILALSGISTITNSTISNNSSFAGGGIRNFGNSTLNVFNSTITENLATLGGSFGGGGIETGGAVNIANTIVAGNTAPVRPDVTDGGRTPPAFNSLGHNLIGITDGTGGFTATGDQTGSITTPLNPMLGPLQANGGPTWTHRLLCSSPAIDSGSNALVDSSTSTDQRGLGYARIRNGGGSLVVDIGAFELQHSCNTAPTASLVGLSTQRGAPVLRVQIGTAYDAEQNEDELLVTVEGEPGETNNGVRVSNVEVTMDGRILADVVASCAATNASFAIRVTDNAGLFTDAVLSVIITRSSPPTISLKPDLTIFSNNHDYRTVSLQQMVQNISDDCDENLFQGTVIEKVTSDEAENASGNSDGNTRNDIVIAPNCRSVKLRAERDSLRNGRVYVVTLVLEDSDGNIIRANFRVRIPINQSSPPAVQDVTMFDVNSNCQ